MRLHIGSFKVLSILINIFIIDVFIACLLVSEQNSLEGIFYYMKLAFFIFVIGIFVNYFLLKIPIVRNQLFNLMEGERKKIAKSFIHNSFISIIIISLYLIYKAIKKLYYIWDREIDKIAQESI